MCDTAASYEKSGLELDSIDWYAILNSIQNEQCILALGPQLLMDEDGNNVLDKVRAEILAIIKKENPKNFDSLINADTDLLIKFLIGKITNGRMRWDRIAKEHLRGTPPNDIFNKIAKIPFNLILTTSPDLFLVDIATENGNSLTSQFFKFRGGAHDSITESPTKKNPLLFSLFGNIENPDNIILENYTNLTSFISNYYKESVRLPKVIEDQIKDSKICILLGFDFNNWYFNILLDALHLHINEQNGNEWEANYAHPHTLDTSEESTKSFYNENFKMQFICSSQTSIKTFIDELLEKCIESDDIELRKKDENPISPEELSFKKVETEVKNLLKIDKIPEALNAFEDFISEQLNKPQPDSTYEEAFDEVISYNGQLTGVNKDLAKGIISLKDKREVINKIREATIQLLNSLKPK